MILKRLQVKVVGVYLHFGAGLHPITGSVSISVQCVQVGAWASSNKMSIGELWVRLLRFYCLEFNSIQHVVSIRQQEPLQRSEKKWHSKRLAIEGIQLFLVEICHVSL